MFRSLNRFTPGRLMFITNTDDQGGGKPNDADADAKPTDADADEGDGKDAPDADADEAALGDKGKQAIERMKERLRTEKAARVAAERERDEAKGVTEQERARREADAQVLAKANGRILRSEIKTAAKGVLADPADAFKFIDLDQFEVDDDGNVDEAEIAKAVADLVKQKPYLAAAQGQQQRFLGKADQGARNASQKSEEQQLTDALGEATKARDFERAVQIRQRLAALKSASA